MLFLMPIVIHTMTMMQQFTLAVSEIDFDCTQISCNSECPSNYKRSEPEVFFQLQNSSEKELEFNRRAKDVRDDVINFCCNAICRGACLHNGILVRDGYETQNPENPCEQFVCDNGTVKRHTSLCRPLSCPRDHQITRRDECCPVCHETWANFCKTHDDEEECEIVCQFGFVKNEILGCDECKCRKVSTTTKSPNDDKSIKYNFYFYPDQNIFIFISIALSVVLVACIVGISVLFHRKVYKRIPLSLLVSKA